jgi:hypothetical protein
MILVLFPQRGKCRIFPVTRKSARAASANSTSMLSCGIGGDLEPPRGLDKVTVPFDQPEKALLKSLSDVKLGPC